MKQATHFQVGKTWKMIILGLGFKPADVLRRAGLPQDLFGRSGATLSVDDYFNLWHGLEKAADDTFGSEKLPVKIADTLSAEIFDPPVFASLCSPNLLVAMQRLSHFKRLMSPMILRVDNNENGLVVTKTCYKAKDVMPYALGALEAVFMTNIARIATRHAISPISVTLPEIPDNTDDLNDWLGVKVKKGNDVVITFSKEDALRPFLTEDNGMWEFFEPGLQQRLHELDNEASMTDKVKATLLEMLPSGFSSMEEAAKRLAMSKRTLQRKLKEEEGSFQHILQHVREDLAKHYLSSSELSHGEISFLLGFNDTNSFIRAYSSWTGEPPGQFRSGLHEVMQ
jgi:AraC-like DNA-binding protein